jgi:single-strand DNA-binding protein
MTSFNKVILLGNLTRDPEVRYTPSGTAVASFALAVNRKYKQGDETKEEVSYIDIVVFGKQAENCGQYLNKGDAALIEGRLQQRRWDDKETGQKRSKVEVAAQAVTFMPKRQQGGAGGGSGSSQSHGEPLPEPPVDDSDIPF